MKPLDAARLRHEIDTAESGTTGRIGVRVLVQSTPDALEAARAQFHEAGLHGQPERNAVLFLVAPKVKRFAVFGGEAIHERVGDEFWSQLVIDMAPYFVKNRPTDGLALGIARVGDQLRRHFPSP